MTLSRLLTPLLLALTLLSVGASAHACGHEGMEQPQAGAACPADGMHRQGHEKAAKPFCCNENEAQTGSAAPHDPHGCCIDPAQGGHLPTGAAPVDGAWLDLASPLPVVMALLPLPRPAPQTTVFPTLRTPPPSSGVGSARLIC
ncbi:MAG: hypothetical protein COX57_07950 [Alphaproteobacteria bacterium CG_4_10_14_0_2_um_filter_63_37]|nr:MAG: hypothetical protein AUJ55_03750 [Proteobacteria bacterium CG1_02_64_396]PJA24552.1 MAG: hypothetical protein COX57_07950 [Alphaproteobacteria bacterium CG_4_10_14_0_2_um_filter_63_37]